MTKVLVTLFLLFIAGLKGVTAESASSDWLGEWSNNIEKRSIIRNLPFHSEFSNETIIIDNERPDRAIYYEIINENGEVFIQGEVSKENAAQIVIPVAELPDNKTYMIVLTSPYPMDRVYCSFFKNRMP